MNRRAESAPSTSPASANRDQLVLGAGNSPTTPSSLQLPLLHPWQSPADPDPGREYGAAEPHLTHAVTVPACDTLLYVPGGQAEGCTEPELQ